MLVLVVITMVGVVACTHAGVTTSSSEEAMETVSGSVTYRERIALPPATVVTVRLEDVSLADAPAKVLAEQKIELSGQQVPIPYSLKVDSTQIDPRSRIVLRALIRSADGGLLFTNTTAELVEPGQDNTNRMLVLQHVGGRSGDGEAQASVQLLDTTWKLVKLGNVEVDPAASRMPSQITLAAGADAGMSGIAVCNRIIGSYTLDGEALHLRPGATTMMACVPGPLAEGEVLAALNATTGYRIDGSQLQLLDATGTVLATYVR